MKKSLMIVALAMVLVFAFSGIASAKITNGYITWATASANLDGTAATPHSGYTVNTEKCAVCHSVHNAAVAGTAWTGTDPWTARTGEETQMLLRSSVANACIYCHITTNIGGTQLYNANEVLWTNPASISTFEENVAHNRNSANCVNCHAVHGANTFQGLAASKILKVPADTTKIQDEVLGASADITLVGGLYPNLATAVADTTVGKDYQVTVFCTQCHQNFSRSSETTLNADGDYVYGDGTYVDGDATANLQYKSHPMKAAGGEATAFAAAGATYTTGAVAWKASTTCRSCHDAGLTDEGVVVTANNFPHYTAGAFNFVNVAANAAATAAPSGHDNGSDGMCLKCHVQDGVGTAGVGDTFLDSRRAFRSVDGGGSDEGPAPVAHMVSSVGAWPHTPVLSTPVGWGEEWHPGWRLQSEEYS